MKKFIVPALFAFLFVLASCMNMSGGSEKGGSIRVATHVHAGRKHK